MSVAPPIASPRAGDVALDEKKKREPARHADHGLPPWRRRTRLGLRVFAIAIVSLYALYVVVANIAIKTRLVRDAILKFPKRSVEYGSAWTLWPGVVHVDDLHIRVRDSDFDFLIVVDHAVVDVDLPALMGRKFHARSVDAHGLSYRMRMRIDPKVEPPPVTYALPPIEGLEPVPYQDVPKPPPLQGKEIEEVFVFDLENIQVDGVHEIWIDDYRWAGEGKVDGKFFLAPARSLAVGPAHVALTDGTLSLGSDSVLEHAGVDARVEVAWFQPRKAVGNEFFKHLSSIDAKIDGHIPSYDFVERRYVGVNGPHVSGGAGDLHLDAHLRDGVITDFTTLTLDAKDLTIEKDKLKAKSSVGVKVSVQDHDGAPEAAGMVTLIGAGVVLPDGGPNATLTASEAGLFARTKRLSLSDKPFDDLLYSVDIPQLKLVDLRYFQHLLPKGSPLRIEKGSIAAHVHLDAPLSGKGGQGSVQATCDDGKLSYNDAQLVGHVALDMKLTGVDTHTLDADLSHTTLDLHDVTLILSGDARPPWWGHLELATAKIRPKQKTTLTTHFAMKLRDLRPILSTYATDQGMPKWLTNVVAMEDFAANGDLRVGEGIDLDDFFSASDHASVDARYHSLKGHTKAALLVTWNGLTAGIDIDDSGASPVLIEPTSWFRGK